jgi:hypothetical protein
MNAQQNHIVMRSLEFAVQCVEVCIVRLAQQPRSDVQLSFKQLTVSRVTQTHNASSPNSTTGLYRHLSVQHSLRMPRDNLHVAQRGIAHRRMHRRFIL